MVQNPVMRLVLIEHIKVPDEASVDNTQQAS